MYTCINRKKNWTNIGMSRAGNTCSYEDTLIKNRFNTGEDRKRGENTCVELRGAVRGKSHHPTGKIAFLSSRNSLLLPTIYLSLTFLYLVYRRPRTATRDKNQRATRSIAAKKLPLVFLFSCPCFNSTIRRGTKIAVKSIYYFLPTFSTNQKQTRNFFTRNPFLFGIFYIHARSSSLEPSLYWRENYTSRKSLRAFGIG